MRRTIKEIETNVAYRWFLGLGLDEKVPNFSTFGKNYVRRFQDTDVFESIFYRVLFINFTYIKANANKRKYKKKFVRRAAELYKEELDLEVNEERIFHGKKPFTLKMKKAEEHET